IFTPSLQRVLSRGNILDFETAVFVGHSKIRRRHNDDVARHFGMHVAKERSRAEVIELERFLLTLRPGAKIVRELLVSADRRPVNIVADGIAVQELYRCSLL